MLEKIAQKILQQLPAEVAHDAAIKMLSSSPARWCSKAKPENPVQLMGIDFPNPVGLAAGFDKNGDAIDGLQAMGFGFVEIGTVTPKPQLGNPKPRLFRLPKDRAIINRMGFNNKGLDYLLGQMKKSNNKGVLGINIGKNKTTDNQNAADDYTLCFEKVHQHCDYVTVNISSPNTPDLRDLQNDRAFAELLAAIKNCRQRVLDAGQKYTPILIKVAPDQSHEQLQFMTETIIKSGIDGIICNNTTIDRPPLKSAKPLVAQQGGLSGKPLFEKSNQCLATIRKSAGSDFPIIAVGGIMSAQDAMEKFKLGADLVQIYSGFIYQGGHLVTQINQQYREYRQ